MEIGHTWLNQLARIMRRHIKLILIEEFYSGHLKVPK